MGVGSASIGGSALLGTGAFSRVESDRSVTIEVAEDPDAYLGLDKCGGHDNPTPNGSYAHLDEDGHLEILMNPENPTHNGEEDNYLGAGINSNSTTWFDNVFQICNQGKEDICVWISDSESWPRVDDDEPDAGERRVEFYLGADDDRSLIGEENAIGIPLGECVCVGIKTRSHGLSAEEELLEALDNTIEIVADVDGLCFSDPGERCPIYGISQGTGVQQIEVIGIPNFSDTSHIVDLDGFDETEQFYPNGLAFDDDEGDWYFTTQNGDLHVYDGSGFETLGQIGTGSAVAGAAWFMQGHYYFVPNGSSDLWRVDRNGDDEVVGDLGIDSINLGDVAIEGTTTYISTSSSGSSAQFIEVELSASGSSIETVDVVADASDSDVDLTSHAVNKQIAFGPDGILYAHQAGSGVGTNGNWYTVDLANGELSEVVGETKEYTDLAQCAFPPAFTG